MKQKKITQTIAKENTKFIPDEEDMRDELPDFPPNEPAPSTFYDDFYTTLSALLSDNIKEEQIADSLSALQI